MFRIAAVLLLAGCAPAPATISQADFDALQQQVTDLQTQLDAANARLDALPADYSAYVTADDLAAYATTDDLAAYVTSDDLAVYATLEQVDALVASAAITSVDGLTGGAIGGTVQVDSLKIFGDTRWEIYADYTETSATCTEQCAVDSGVCLAEFADNTTSWGCERANPGQRCLCAKQVP